MTSFTRSLIALCAGSLFLTACGAPQTPMTSQTPAGQILQPVAAAPAATAVMADVGHGQKTPAQLSFRINLADVAGFSTKASQAGTAAKTKADLTHIKFYLAESDTGSAPTALGGTAFTYAITATNRTNNRVDVTFTNVAANSSGKSYYVLVAGFSSNTFTAANNITHLGAPINDGSEGMYFASNSGGDPDNAGCVRVSPVSYALSGSDALGLPLKLLDAVSPVLDSEVNITAGDEISGDPEGSAH